MRMHMHMHSHHLHDHLCCYQMFGLPAAAHGLICELRARLTPLPLADDQQAEMRAELCALPAWATEWAAKLRAAKEADVAQQALRSENLPLLRVRRCAPPVHALHE